MKNRSTAWRLGLCALSLIGASVLVACGGGGAAATDSLPVAASAPTSSALGSSLVEGTITGFGSVIIDGERYPDTGATVDIGNNPALKTTGTLGDLRTGMRVQAELKDGVLQNLSVNFALVGTLSAVNTAAGTLTVFGQTIKTSSTGQLPTVLDGFSALTQLQVGDLIKVAGSVASDGSITATRIERRLKDGSELFRLSGAVQGLDSTAKRFTLSGNSSVTVDYSQAKLLPSSALIENGKLVSVLATAAPLTTGGQTVLTASAIEVKSRKLPDGKDVSVGGQINDSQSLASLRIGDVVVDASTAVLKDGTVVADIVNGAQALTQGSLSNGVLKAASLKVFKQDTALKALLIGQVSDFVSLANFNLRGTAVDASQATFTKGKAADLATGTWVKISGQLTSTGVLAKEVEIQPPPADKPARLEGAISAVNLATKRFNLLGTPVQWSDATTVSPAGKALANLADGVVLAAEGSYSEATGVFTATSVKLSSTTGVSRTLGFSGILFDVSSSSGSSGSSGSFKVGSNLVLLSSSTQLQPAGTTLSDLKNGSRVSVTATVSLVDGKATLTAATIELQKPEKASDGQEYVYLSGLITDFVSSANFMLAGQKVDASGNNVEFIDGTAAKLGNGLKIEVKGSLKDGVLIPKRVHFMPG
jgi:hypothetical protein